MGKSRRYNNDQSFKSHHLTNKFKKHHIKSGWEPKRSDSDRDINRRIRQGEFDYN